MSSEFQPDKPHPKTEGPEPLGYTSIVVAAVLCALVVVMAVAMIVPGIVGDDGANWLITLGLGLLTFIGVLAGGYWYRSVED